MKKPRYRVYRWDDIGPGPSPKFWVVNAPRAAICLCVNRRDGHTIAKALNRVNAGSSAASSEPK